MSLGGKKTPANPIVNALIPPEERTVTWIDRSKSKRVVPMEVICAGWSRTGTVSTALALRTLGLSQIYHFIAIHKNPPDAKMWMRATDAKFYGKGTFTKEDWDGLLGHCMATTDWPCALFVDELVAAYPDAKVVLTIRDTEKWWKSFQDTVLVLAKPTFIGKLVDMFLIRFHPALGLVFPMRDKLHAAMCKGQDPYKVYKQLYLDHNEHVKSIVPPERLLIWGPADGWEPLCKFLDKPIPEGPVPHVNESKEFWEWRKNTIRKKFTQVGVKFLGLVAVGSVAAMYLGYLKVPTFISDRLVGGF